MKKINYVTFSSIPSTLPSSLQIIKTCENLAKYGHDVTLIKPGTGNKKISLKKYYGLKFHVNLKEFIFFKSFPRGADFYLYCFVCLFFILKKKNSITITRNYFICFLLGLFKKKTILEIHHDTGIEGRLTRFILKYSNFFKNNKLLKIIAITNSVKDLFIKKYNVSSEKIIVLPSGSSLQTKQLPIIKNKKKLRIGYFGSFSPSKGINTLIKLSKIDPNNDYYLYGGSKKEILRLKKINTNRNLILKESIPYARLPNIIKEMDILTLPYTKIVRSAGEVDDISKFTSPLKLFDYMAAGKMIITSDLEVLREVLNSKNAFFINNNENIYEWKKKIDLAKNSKNKTYIFGKNNLKLSKKYHHSIRVKSYLDT